MKNLVIERKCKKDSITYKKDKFKIFKTQHFQAQYEAALKNNGYFEVYYHIRELDGLDTKTCELIYKETLEKWKVSKVLKMGIKARDKQGLEDKNIYTYQITEKELIDTKDTIERESVFTNEEYGFMFENSTLKPLSNLKRKDIIAYMMKNDISHFANKNVYEWDWDNYILN